MDDEKLFGLNRKMTLKKYREDSLCLFPGCMDRAIRSHIYPRSFLVRYPESNSLLTLNLDEAFTKGRQVDSEKWLTSVAAKSAGVERLFCGVHDDKIFHRIEDPEERLRIDLEVYLFLYGYRLFLHEFYLESLVKDDAINAQIHPGTNFAGLFSEEAEATFIEEEKDASMLGALYPLEISQALKDKFDNDVPSSSNSSETPSVINRVRRILRLLSGRM
ncbi:hypothetical protein ACUH96_06355 [Dermabacteraceae bacterium P13077]